MNTILPTNSFHRFIIIPLLQEELARKLTEACPVDIYAQSATGTLELVEKNLDECVLCRLCLDAAPEGAVKIIKLYDDGAVL